MIFAIGDSVWNALIGGIVTIIMGIISNRNRKQIVDATVESKKAVVEAVVQKSDPAMVEMVRENARQKAVALRKLANITKYQSDIDAADAAERAI